MELHGAATTERKKEHHGTSWNIIGPSYGWDPLPGQLDEWHGGRWELQTNSVRSSPCEPLQDVRWRVAIRKKWSVRKICLEHKFTWQIQRDAKQFFHQALVRSNNLHLFATAINSFVLNHAPECSSIRSASGQWVQDMHKHKHHKVDRQRQIKCTDSNPFNMMPLRSLEADVAIGQQGSWPTGFPS
jgi:hypothetical protein